MFAIEAIAAFIKQHGGGLTVELVALLVSGLTALLVALLVFYRNGRGD